MEPNFPNPAEQKSTSMMPSLQGLEDAWGQVAEEYVVKYLSGCLSDLGFKSEVEEVLTEGIKGDEIVILEKTGYSFKEDYFLVVQYMQRKKKAAPQPPQS